MKLNMHIQPSPTRMKSFLNFSAALMVFVSPHAQSAQSAAELMEKGIYAEETKGDLNAATRVYQQIVDHPRADRSLVAQAQLRLGLCELKQGHKPQAISALERLTQDFPDKEKLLGLVEPHMPQLLEDLVKQIEQNYILEVDRTELFETAIRAIVGKLDARGFLRTNDMEFIGTNELAEMNLHLDQKVAGIGAQLKLDDTTGEVVVTTPMPGSPALKGGLRSGDRLVQVNGSALPAEKKLEGVVKLLRGPVGTAVTVGVKREGVQEPLVLQLVRDTIKLPSVKADHYKPDLSWDFMLDDQKKIGYVRLTQVGRQSPAEMQAALEELKSRGMKGLILDLRNNPGGALGEAVQVADLFVESGRIVTVKGREQETVYDAKADGTFSGFPMALLVNRNTASAAEIIAACLQDHQRAIIVGERSFGQAVVRSLISLKDGVGMLKLPVATYYRPNGKNMNRFPGSKETDDWGVSPDAGYEIALNDEELKQYDKACAAREVLLSETTSKVESHDDRFQDRQLQRALEYLQAHGENR
jgi:carboxyl-terminal processing protease